MLCYLTYKIWLADIKEVYDDISIVVTVYSPTTHGLDSDSFLIFIFISLVAGQKESKCPDIFTKCVDILLIFQKMPIYRQSISIFHQKSMKTLRFLLIFYPKCPYWCWYFREWPYRYWYQYFQEWPYRYFQDYPFWYRYRYQYFYEWPYRYQYF